MSNRITIELCEEDRQRLDLIASLLTVGIEKHVGKQDVPQQAEKTEKVEPVNEHPVDDVSPHVAPEPAVEPEPVAEANYTKADVQALVLKLAAPGTGKKDAVKAIVNEYAKKVSDIPEEKLNEVMAKLQKLAEEE
jgi:predicted AAA+ superfamily ATPase